MLLDRKLQNEILNQAANHYPSAMVIGRKPEFKDLDSQRLTANLLYLEENLLIKPKSFSRSIDGSVTLMGVQITHKGLDFLQDDGGLSAILNVVTIKFEADTLKAILTSKINSADIEDEKKSELMKAVEELPAEGLRHVMTRVLDKGMDNIPHLIPYLSQVLNGM